MIKLLPIVVFSKSKIPSALNFSLMKTPPSIFALWAQRAPIREFLLENLPAPHTKSLPITVSPRTTAPSALKPLWKKTLPPILAESTQSATPPELINCPPLHSRLPSMIAPVKSTSPSALKLPLRQTFCSILAPSTFKATPLMLMNCASRQSKSPAIFVLARFTSPSALKPYLIKTLPCIFDP